MMTTPEEWADAIIQSYPDNHELIRAMIVDAIRVAVAEEREACALIVDNHYPNGRASDLDTIAAAIRARTT